jgi:hypothetical protein
MSGTVTPGKVQVFKNSAAALTLSLPTGVTATNLAAVQFNGNDAMAIGKGASTFATQIDIFGNIGCDPGSAWTGTGFSTLDKTLTRKSSVTTGIAVDNATSCPFPTLTTEWNQANQDDVSNIGFHKAEVSRRTKVQFMTLKKMNLNSLKITDRGLCSGGTFLDITNDVLITFPSSGLENVLAGTFVNLIWNSTGTNDLDGSDGVITIYGGIASKCRTTCCYG